MFFLESQHVVLFLFALLISCLYKYNPLELSIYSVRGGLWHTQGGMGSVCSADGAEKSCTTHYTC